MVERPGTPGIVPASRARRPVATRHLTWGEWWARLRWSIVLILSLAIVGCGSSSERSQPASIPIDSSLPAFVRGDHPPTAVFVGADGNSPGLLLASRWFDGQGEIVELQPSEASKVDWPPSVASGKGQGVTFRINAGVRPTVLQVTESAGDLDERGQPKGPSSTIECDKTDAKAPCVLTLPPGAAEVRFLPSAEPEHVVLYAQWFVPSDARPVAANDNPIVSASWGFTIGA